jgi:hypothetical protein
MAIATPKNTPGHTGSRSARTDAVVLRPKVPKRTNKQLEKALAMDLDLVAVVIPCKPDFFYPNRGSQVARVHASGSKRSNDGFAEGDVEATPLGLVLELRGPNVRIPAG